MFETKGYTWRWKPYTGRSITYDGGFIFWISWLCFDLRICKEHYKSNWTLWGGIYEDFSIPLNLRKNYNYTKVIILRIGIPSSKKEIEENRQKANRIPVCQNTEACQIINNFLDGQTN